ncbi:MAG: alkaline phosphatase family protein [Anaerolineales bacterium]
MAERAIIFGIDGLILPLIEEFVSEGRLPHFARMFREGAFTQVLPYVSTWGPINWNAFASGAPPGMAWQGRLDVSGLETPEDVRQAIQPAERLWETSEGCGQSSVVMAYPMCWPPSIRQGVVAIPDRSGTNLPPTALARPTRYMTSGLAEEYQQPPGTRTGWIPLERRGRSPAQPPIIARPGPPGDWRNLPPGKWLATSFCIREIGSTRTREIGLLQAEDSKKQDSIHLCDGKDGGQVLVELHEGQWTEWLPWTFDREEGFVRFKMLEFRPQEREVALCHSEIYPQNGFVNPPSMAEELLDIAGPYASGSSAQLRPSDPFWGTAIEEARYEGEWLAAAARHCLMVQDRNLFMTVYRPVDAAHHGCLAFTDPNTPHHGGGETKVSMDILRAIYDVADDILGAFMGMADEDTVVAVASDHGAAVNRVTCDIYNLLQEKGLLTIEEQEGRPTVNWSETKAYIRPGRSASEVFVNLAGREPQGTVQADEYEDVQREIIEALLSWRAPETGQRAVALALTRRDATLLGYWGKAAGDVQFIYNEGFVWGELPAGQSIACTGIPSVNHGPQVPTAARGLWTNMGMFALWGPGVRQGYRRDEEALGPARMCDPAPTIAHLLRCRGPHNSTGTLLQDMLE